MTFCNVVGNIDVDCSCLDVILSVFYSLQHSCMDGAYKPWAPETRNAQEGDCVVADGPDCEVC